MVIDRALYLRRSVKRKLMFHLISVAAIHIWLFNYMNSFNETSSWPPLLFYFIKCIYFLFSAYQIRCGYPNRISGNFATSGFTTIHCRIFELYVKHSFYFTLNMQRTLKFFFFQQIFSFHFIPFLSESRTLLDWICSKTSLSLSDWFKMEDIFKEVFILKVNVIFYSVF